MSQQLIEKTPQVAEQLQCYTIAGLWTAEAERRLKECGRNEIGEQQGVQPIKILIGQIANALTLVRCSPFLGPSKESQSDFAHVVLILAMAASFGIQSWIEGGVVAAVIMLNIVVGFFQEFQAAKTMDSLR
ncbi:hypothetical protein FOXYS1_14507, partial [Fusarium oxysporum]